MTEDDLARALAPHHLTSLGHCPMEGGTLCLIGPDEPTFWPAFKQSPEYQDGDTNPMDRWSLRVLTEVAQDLGAKPFFPFQGPPYRPFQTWALQTGRFANSAIGFLAHDERGLFASFRGALLAARPLAPCPKHGPCSFRHSDVRSRLPRRCLG